MRGSLCLSPLQLFRNYKAGDVIIASNPNDPNTIVCKRIIAMPKEKVYSKSGLCAPPCPPIPSFMCLRQPHSNCPRWSQPITVPEGHVWLQGDNRENSTDSRRYGPVPIAMFVLHHRHHAAHHDLHPPTRLTPHDSCCQVEGQSGVQDLPVEPSRHGPISFARLGARTRQRLINNSTLLG